MKKPAERALEGVKELTFPDRVARAMELAEQKVGSDKLPEVLAAAVQLVGFGDDLTTEDENGVKAAEAAWTEHQHMRLAA